ncbi:MAG: DUF4838 domain-containing protein [Kiritimatiellaeota bacterium]|nr:DUF4838 domain-containing protein [Kiritimatiellota bacterium]
MHGKMEIARGGRTDYAIITNTNATAAEQFAAQELSDYLAKVTGAHFKVMSETNPALPARAIYVGWTDFASKQGIDVKSLGAEEWIIKSFGENLVLTGGRPRGTLYSVYEFLEQEIGCHWLDEFTEIVPSKPELKLNNLNIKDRPLFWDRHLGTGFGWTCVDGTYSTRIDGKLMCLFDARNKETSYHKENLAYSAPYGLVVEPSIGSPCACHTFYAYSEDWQTNHPEYLAMNDKGERVRSTSGAGPGQICLTNPEARKLMLAKLRQYIVMDKEKASKRGVTAPKIYCIETNDNELTCQCPGCQALIEREGANAGAMVDLANFLADGIKDEFPDVLVDTFAYLQTLTPPKTIRPRDNVIIRIAQLNARPFLDGKFGNRLEERPDYFRPMAHPVNRSCCETFLAWSKIAKHISCWDYWVQYADKFKTPYINLACIKPDLELFLDSHVETMYVECEYAETSSFFALKRWLGLKLMQNPRQPAEPLIAIFMSGYYGPASSKMSAYLAYMEQRINAFPETEKLSVLEEQNRPYLDLDFYVTSNRLLDEAEAMCGTNKQALLHVQRERITVDSGLLGMWAPLQAKLPAGKTMPFDHEAIFKRYEALRLAQMEAVYSKDQLPRGKAEVEKEIRDFRVGCKTSYQITV